MNRNKNRKCIDLKNLRIQIDFVNLYSVVIIQVNNTAFNKYFIENQLWEERLNTAKPQNLKGGAKCQKHLPELAKKLQLQ